MRLFGFLKKNNSDIINELIRNVFEKSREYIDFNDEYPETFSEYKSDIVYLSLVRLELEKVLSKSDMTEEYIIKDINFFNNLKIIIALFNTTSKIYNKADTIEKEKINKNYEKCISYLTKVKYILYDEFSLNEFFEDDSINFVIDSMGKISVINSEIIEFNIQFMKNLYNENIKECYDISKKIYSKFNQIHILAYNIQSLKRSELSLELMISGISSVKSFIDEFYKNESVSDKYYFEKFLNFINTIENYCEIIQCEINKLK